MGPQIIVSAHAPVEITKPYKVGLRYAVLELLLLIHLVLTKCKNLPWKISIKIAIPIYGMLINVNNLKS